MLTPGSRELRYPIKLACRRACSPTCPGWVIEQDVLRLALHPCPRCWQGAADPITPAELMEVPDAVRALGAELVKTLTLGTLAGRIYPEIVGFRLAHSRVEWTEAEFRGKRGSVRVERSDLQPNGEVIIRSKLYPPETRVIAVRWAVE